MREGPQTLLWGAHLGDAGVSTSLLHRVQPMTRVLLAVCGINECV